MVGLAVAPGAAAPLPELPLTTVDGMVLEPSALADRVVLIEFWATWCAPCLARMPELEQAWERHREAGFMVVGVSLDRAHRRQLVAFLRRHGIDWPQLWDGRGFEGAMARRFGVEAVPRSFLFDRRGRLVAADLDGEALEAVVPALLGESPSHALLDQTLDRGAGGGVELPRDAAGVGGQPAGLDR
jgi:thiol-disulfide isomerase/thioredoxin